jgi:transcription antitermination factor NusG
MGENDLASSDRARRWFALRVRSRNEKQVSLLLKTRGLEEFFPFYATRRRWSDRTITAELPLFPGYVFCRFDPMQRLSIITTPGVIEIVGNGQMIGVVDEREIEAIRRVMECRADAQPWPYLRTGDWVRVDGGLLDGLEGILLREKKAPRVVISVTLLRRSISIEVDRSRVVLLGNAPRGLHPHEASA